MAVDPGGPTLPDQAYLNHPRDLISPVLWHKSVLNDRIIGRQFHALIRFYSLSQEEKWFIRRNSDAYKPDK